MRAPLLLLFLVLAVKGAIYNYTYNFSSYYPMQGKLVTHDMFSVFDLGTVKNGDIVTINMSLPDYPAGGSSSNFYRIGYCLYLAFFDPSDPLSPISAKNSDGQPYIFPGVASPTDTFYTATYTAAFPNFAFSSALFRLSLSSYYMD